MIPWFAWSAGLLALGAVHRLLPGADRFPAKRGLSHHLHSCAGGLDVDVHLSGDGVLGGDRPGLQYPFVVHDGARAGADRAMFTFIALWTGALWGKPMWGAWWVWDARLTSELILLFPLCRHHRAVGGDRRCQTR
jgi:hypothetical protein